MKTARWTLLFFLVCALALAPSAGAAGFRFMAAGSGKIELSRGTGKAVFAGRGSMLGRFANGRLVVVLPARGTRPDVTVTGEERTVRSGRRTTYIGRNVSFSILGGSWRASVSGRGIYASAGLRGTVTLAGRAGTYSVNGGKARPWPRDAETIRLGR